MPWRVKNGGRVLLESGTLQCLLLVASTTTPSNEHEFVSDIVADEGADASYARVAANNPVISYDAGPPDFNQWTTDDIVFPNLAGGPYTWAEIFENSGGADNARRLVFGWAINHTGDGTNLILRPGNNGIVRVGTGTIQ